MTDRAVLSFSPACNAGQRVTGRGACAWQVDRWVRCDPVPGALVVNVGDLLEIWSDGRVRSNYHRVRQPAGAEAQGACLSLCDSGSVQEHGAGCE